jgi:hypothetical protein
MALSAQYVIKHEHLFGSEEQSLVCVMVNVRFESEFKIKVHCKVFNHSEQAFDGESSFADFQEGFKIPSEISKQSKTRSEKRIARRREMLILELISFPILLQNVPSLSEFG